MSGADESVLHTEHGYPDAAHDKNGNPISFRKESKLEKTHIEISKEDDSVLIMAQTKCTAEQANESLERNEKDLVKSLVELCNSETN